MSVEEQLHSRHIEALQVEERRFPPPPEFVAQANAKPEVYEEANGDYEAFWAARARELEWSKPFTRVLEWNEPFARWFADGELNISVNCLDRHVRAGRGERVAYYFEGEPGDRRAVTYNELLLEVCRFANALRAQGIKRGDRVAIYLPMIVELPVAMLACTRIGAAHSVIFGGFSPDAIVDRVTDSGCIALITADFGWRRGKTVPLKENCDAAMERMPDVKCCIVVKRTGDPVNMEPGRDVWWHELIEGQPATCEPEPVDAENLLFILYTSGTTAKPKGIKHTTGGYLTGAATTHKYVFDVKDDDVYWCTADIGWVTGHSYMVYGPLANGTSIVMYEGAPDFPRRDRFWEIVARYKVTIFYSSATAVRAFMAWGNEWIDKYDISSLRLLGTVGGGVEMVFASYRQGALPDR
jgi:acetyl-CoA synthetase